MKERPIIFSGESVRAILDGRKTQTRRVVFANARTNNGFDFAVDRIEAALGKEKYFFAYAKRDTVGKQVLCPYGAPDNQLWVRESFSAWFQMAHWRDATQRTKETCDNLFYRATHHFPDDDQKWVAAIYMPRWASHITLEIVNVRVERLWEISREDCIAEGIGSYTFARGAISDNPPDYRWKFIEIWDIINGKRAPWSSNPFVWVLEFKKL